MRSPAKTKSKHHKGWLTTTETEITGPYEQMHSPISPLDKPLPPAYSPRQEEDVGYHTWSWNLLSRPRNERNAPRLTRSPTTRDNTAPWRSPSLPNADIRTTMTSGKCNGTENITSPRVKTSTPATKATPDLHNQLDKWSSPPWTANTTHSQMQSPAHSPKSDASSWASPSFVLRRHVSQCDVRQRLVPGLPDDGFVPLSRPRAMAPIESNERKTPPKLRIRTQNNNTPPLAPPSQILSPSSCTDQDYGLRDDAVSRVGEHALPRMRSESDETVWPYVVPDITKEEVEAAIIRGHAV